MTVVRLELLILLLIPLAAVAGRFDPLDLPLPDLEVIPGASSQWVGRQMAHNGMPMSVRLFEFRGMEVDVEKYYRSLFRVKGHGESQFRNLGEYRVIGYELRGYLYSVQYRQRGSVVEGKLIVSPTPDRYRSNRSTRLPIPPGCSVLNKVESLDYGKRSETVTINCHKSLDKLEYFYLTSLEGERWSLVRNRKTDLGSVLDYQRGSETLQIIIKQYSQKNKRLVNILINWIKS